MKQFGLACLTLIAWFNVGRADEAAERRATAAYVRSLQGRDGGFYGVRPTGIAPGPGGTSLPATLAAVRALKYFGGDIRDEKACVQFVERCRDAKSGGFANRPGWVPDATSTALGIMALVDLKQPKDAVGKAGMKYLGEHAHAFEEIRMAAAAAEALGTRPPEADKWIDYLRNVPGFGRETSSEHFTTRDPVGQASVAVTILRLGGTATDRAALLKTLRDGQRSDGGFGQVDGRGSDLGSCYRVMRAFAMLKEKPASPAKLREFIAKCRNADGGYGIKPGEPSNVSATYNAGIVLHWLEQK
jgi:hypothetical protein